MTRRTTSPAAGYSLVELLIGLAVAAVLAAIAYGSHVEQVKASRRSEARRVLVEAALAMEQNFVVARRYDRDGAGAPFADGVNPISPPFPAALRTVGGADGAPIYDIRFVEPPGAESFALVAQRRSGGSMGEDACGDFVIDHSGRRSLRDAPAASATECWQRGRP